MKTATVCSECLAICPQIEWVVTFIGRDHFFCSDECKEKWYTELIATDESQINRATAIISR